MTKISVILHNCSSLFSLYICFHICNCTPTVYLLSINEYLLTAYLFEAFPLQSTTVYLIAQYPEVEKKLLAELDAFGPADQMPTAQDLQIKFPHVDQVKFLKLQSIHLLLFGCNTTTYQLTTEFFV